MDEGAFQEAVLTLRAAAARSSDDGGGRGGAAAAPGSEAGAGDPGAPAMARCRPWSEGDYFQRLRSFRPQTWFGKSLQAAPPRCAAHGWVNDGMDRLRCEGCHSTLTIEQGVDDEAVPDVSSPAHHTAVCPWAGQACPPEVTQFPLATPEALLARAGRRFQGCRQLLAQHQGRLSVVTPHDLAAFLGAPLRLPLAAVARRLRQEAARAEGHEDEEEDAAAAAAAASDPIDVGAAVLSLHGWEASGGASGGGGGGTSGTPWGLGCGLCGRRVEVARLLAGGRASVSPLKATATGGTNLTSPGRRTRNSQRAQEAEAMAAAAAEGKADFDPVEQHRYYCPWAASGGLVAAGDGGGVGEEGWRQVCRAVASRTPKAWFAASRAWGVGGGDEQAAPQHEAEAEAAAMQECLAAGGRGSPSELYKAAQGAMDVLKCL